jgi:hypothetical protein
MEKIESVAEHGTKDQKQLVAKLFGVNDINQITSLDPNTLYSEIKKMDPDDKSVIV